MYENWKILKSKIWYDGDDEKKLAEKQEALEEYAKVATWCNEGQKYTIGDTDKYYKVIPIPELTEEEKVNFARMVRDSYLKQYVDTIVCNPLRWNELSEEEQNDIKEYRLYLLNIPQQKEFPDVNVMSFAEWLNA